MTPEMPTKQPKVLTEQQTMRRALKPDRLWLLHNLPEVPTDPELQAMQRGLMKPGRLWLLHNRPMSIRAVHG